MNFQMRDLFMAVACAFLGSVKGYLVSRVKSLGAIEIFGIRSLGATCFLIPVLIYFSFKLFYDMNTNIILFFRAAIGNVAVCGYYYGFVYLPIAMASLLFYSTPIFTIIIGRFWLKESCGFTEVLSTALSICGVCLVCIPEFEMDYSISTLLGVVGSLVGAFAQAIALVIVRKITEIPPFVISFWWAVVGIIFSTALTGAADEFRPWQCGWEGFILICIAFLGFCSEICLVCSLKSTDAIIISLALTSEIVWAFVIQCLFAREMPSSLTLIGGAVILTSLVLNPLVKLISQNSANTKNEIPPIEKDVA